MNQTRGDVAFIPTDQVGTGLGRRSFLAGAVAAVGSTIVLGAGRADAAQVAVSDLDSGDPQKNPNFPFASDGLLFNYVSGIATTVGDSSVSLLVAGHGAPSKHVTVRVTKDIGVACRAQLNADISDIRPGDRVEFGTNFVGQGKRVARWGAVNPLTGWANVLDLLGGEVAVQSMGEYDKGVKVASLKLHAGTVVRMADGTEYVGEASALSVGDAVYWTGMADNPGYSVPGDIWAVAIHHLVAH